MKYLWVLLLLLFSTTTLAGTATLSWVGATQKNVTSYALSGLASNTYYFVMTAYNAANMQSVYSGEAVQTIIDETVPGPPTGLVVGADLTVYSVAKLKNGFLLIAVALT